MIGRFYSSLCASAVCVSALLTLPNFSANAAEVFAIRSDTFIFEGIPEGEFSRSNFLAVAHVSGERAYSYLPFNTESSSIGINPETDAVVEATLCLYFKSLPGELKSDEGKKSEVKKDSGGITLRGDVEEKNSKSEENQEEKQSEEDDEEQEEDSPSENVNFSGDSEIDEEAPLNEEKSEDKNIEKNEIKKSPPAAAKGSAAKRKSALEKATGNLEKDLETIAEISKKIQESAEERAIEEMKNVVRIEVIGIVDFEHFQELSERFKYSWNGKHNAIAPKHDIFTGKIDEIGVYKLGEIEMDIVNDEYSDAQRIEFSSPELKEFLSFALGIAHERKQQLKFQTHLGKLNRSTIILRQISGPSGIFFYSSDSLPESFQSPGGETVEAEIDEESGELVEVKKEEEPVYSFMERETVESHAAHAASATRKRDPDALKELAMGSAEKTADTLNDPENEEDEQIEMIPDLRPRIILEFTNVGKIED